MKQMSEQLTAVPMSNLTTAAETLACEQALTERKALDDVVDSLQRSFPDLARTAIERAVDRRYLQFYGARVGCNISVIVSREARSDLRGRALVGLAKPSIAL
jgi:hypothetical protein